MGKPSAPRPPATPDLKTAADLAPVMPMTFEVKDGHLWIGGVDMVTLAHEAGTALYVMDEATIRHQLSEYVKWTQFHWKDVDVVYAGKAFMSLAMIKLVEEEGCCLLCASGGELAYAKRANFPMSRVQVHGNNKTPSELVDCVEAGVSRVVVSADDKTAYVSDWGRSTVDVVDTGKGVLWEREMLVAPRLDGGRVPLTVTCATEARYPVFVDGRDSGELCPASDLRIEPGRHSVGLFVIPQNRIWTFDREVQLNRPHRVQFNY